MDRLQAHEQVSLSMDPLLTAKAIAKVLGVHPRTLSRLAQSSSFPQPIRFGRSLRWRADQVLAWLMSRVQVPSPAPFIRVVLARATVRNTLWISKPIARSSTDAIVLR